MRTIHKSYQDPVDLIWLNAAQRLGMRIERSAEVNASWDGDGVLTIGTPETLDPDDCLAQMILHEVCHCLCEGPESLSRLDWGLPGGGPGAKIHEQACLRLQAALADASDPREAPAIAMARVGWHRSRQAPWVEVLDDALARTAAIAGALDGVTTANSLWHRDS